MDGCTSQNNEVVGFDLTALYREGSGALVSTASTTRLHMARIACSASVSEARCSVLSLRMKKACSATADM